MMRPEEPEDWEDPIFMTTLPSREDHPMMGALEGIQSLVYDGETPESLAEHFKSQGNDCVKRGKKYFNDAVEYYSQAIEQGSSDSVANSVYHCNRAQVQLLLENYGRAISDCEKALELDPTNIKACFRAAKAAAALKKYDRVLEFCVLGLALDPANKSLKREMLKAKKCKRELLRKIEERAAEIRAVELKESEMKEMVDRRGITMGKATFQTHVAYGDDGQKSEYSRAATLREDGYSLSWRVVFIYEVKPRPKG